MDGLLLVDKPKGWTSFDVVAKVRSTLRQQAKSSKPKAQGQKTSSSELSALDFPHSAVSPKVKVGHTGTLDPLATGLLVLVLGSYCKRAGEFSKLDKTYEVTMRLGQTSTTGDEEGQKTVVSSKQPAEGDVAAALQSFTGEIKQVPPQYSAIKVGGQRAYKLARAGREVKLEARKVTIYDIKLTEYCYPDVKCTARVSSGTYIRSLVEDIGQTLDTGAYMTDLRRTAVGNLKIAQAIAPDGLTREVVQEYLQTKP
jgi:tRNA pseudouridine55 synthase